MENKNDNKPISLILGCISRIRNVFLNFWEWIKKNPNGFLTLLLAVFTFMLALGTFDMARYTKRLAQSNNESVDYTRKLVQDNRDLVESNLKLLDYTRQANVRSEKLFIGQNKPLIDVTPISITSGENETGAKMALTTFSIVNYSGFVAYNIAIDVKYPGSNTWISEWLKADHDKKTEEPGVVIGKTFLTAPKAPTSNALKELKPEGRAISIHNGQLDLEKTVDGAKYDGNTVLVRVTWENDSGHVFDEIHQYNLLCAESGPGRSFTFIPEGVISQKN